MDVPSAALPQFRFPKWPCEAPLVTGGSALGVGGRRRMRISVHLSTYLHVWAPRGAVQRKPSADMDDITGAGHFRGKKGKGERAADEAWVAPLSAAASAASHSTLID